MISGMIQTTYSFVNEFRHLNHLYQLDVQTRITVLQYGFFGDFITFNTTYGTNLYDMPFGLFVGVNNNFQSIILASVLMRDELEDDGRASSEDISYRPEQSHGSDNQEGVPRVRDYTGRANGKS
ncbi:hypothetical protein VPH35_014264 [Triticum aestivum]